MSDSYVEQPSQPIQLPPGNTFQPLLFVAVFALGEILGMLVKRGSGPSVVQVAEVEKQAKKVAGMAATALQVAEPFIPALRRSSLDNQVREILRAYAQSDSRFQKELDNYHVTIDEVADLVEEAKPEILGAAMFNSPTQVSKSMVELAKEAAVLKSQEQILTHEEALERSKARLEEILQSLRKK